MNIKSSVKVLLFNSSRYFEHITITYIIKRWYIIFTLVMESAKEAFSIWRVWIWYGFVINQHVLLEK